MTATLDDRSKQEARERLTRYLESRNLRKTPERFAILEKVFSLTGHFDVMELYRRMEEGAYHVSRATIYNTLALLVDCGVVTKHQFGNQQAKYEKAIQTANHHHLVCTECGKIKDVRDPEFMRYINTIKYPAFTITGFELTVQGICSSCARKLKKRKSASVGPAKKSKARGKTPSDKTRD